MARAERVDLLRNLEILLASPMVSYITSTRPGAELAMGLDSVRVMYDHLRKLPPDLDWLNLFLHSNGGDPTVPWRLVTLIRDHCKRLRVLVPHHAFSAATLTALGADQIYMHSMGMLGPTDISISSELSPRDAEGNLVPLSAEEIIAYLAFVREDAGINHEDELVNAVLKLADHVHPVVLGSVKRSHSRSRMIASKLMGLIADPPDAHRIDEIVANLTSKLYYHGHPINRTEASQLGLRVAECPGEVEPAMWALYEAYETEMMLRVPYFDIEEFERVPGPPVAPGTSRAVNTRLVQGVIESRERTDVFTTDLLILGTRDEQTGILTTGRRIDRSGWETEV